MVKALPTILKHLATGQGTSVPSGCLYLPNICRLLSPCRVPPSPKFPHLFLRTSPFSVEPLHPPPVLFDQGQLAQGQLPRPQPCGPWSAHSTHELICRMSQRWEKVSWVQVGDARAEIPVVELGLGEACGPDGLCRNKQAELWAAVDRRWTDNIEGGLFYLTVCVALGEFYISLGPHL